MRKLREILDEPIFLKLSSVPLFEGGWDGDAYPLKIERLDGTVETVDASDVYWDFGSPAPDVSMTIIPLCDTDVWIRMYVSEETGHISVLPALKRDVYLMHLRSVCDGSSKYLDFKNFKQTSMVDLLDESLQPTDSNIKLHHVGRFPDLCHMLGFSDAHKHSWRSRLKGTLD